jgi:glycosyltransferase, family 1
LLLIEIDSEETQGIIPGKLFEYMISERPILAIGPYNWDVTPILTKTQTGTFVGYTDASQMKAKIVEFYHQFQCKTLKTNPKKVEQYSRKALTERLAQLI